MWKTIMLDNKTLLFMDLKIDLSIMLDNKTLLFMDLKIDLLIFPMFILLNAASSWVNPIDNYNCICGINS
jgi:hypothetical protein